LGEGSVKIGQALAADLGMAKSSNRRTQGQRVTI